MNKSQILKKIIKDALREVVREELPTIINEALQNNKSLMTSTPVAGPKKKVNYADFLPFRKNTVQKAVPNLRPLINESSKNPLAAFIADAAKNMDASEMNQIAGTGGQQMMEEPMMPMSVQDLGEIDNYSPSNMPNFPR